MVVLDSFMQANCENYNPIKWREIFAELIKRAKKYPLTEIDSVGITKEEMEKIAALNNIRHRRLMFTLLCYAKFLNMRNDSNNGWVSQDHTEIFKAAHIQTTKKEQTCMLHDLYKLGYISFSNKINNTSIKVNIISTESEYEWSVSDFRDLGYEYLYHTNPKGLMRCSICGIVVKKKTNHHKYCNKCYIAIHTEQKRLWQKQHR